MRRWEWRDTPGGWILQYCQSSRRCNFFSALSSKEVGGTGFMSNMADRLALSEAILALIEQKRAETQDETLGLAVERVILDTQFQEIEGESSKIPAPLSLGSSSGGGTIKLPLP